MNTKFRAKAVEELVKDDQWVYGFGVFEVKYSEEYSKEIGRKADYYLYTDSGEYLIDPETIGMKSDWSPIQSWGTDKVEDIYVGDILLDCINNVQYEARWDNGIWFVNLEDDKAEWLTLEELTDNVSSIALAIAGNIYDNPVKVKENPHKEFDWREDVGLERWWENEEDNNAAIVLTDAYYFVLEDEDDEFYDRFLK